MKKLTSILMLAAVFELSLAHADTNISLEKGKSETDNPSDSPKIFGEMMTADTSSDTEQMPLQATSNKSHKLTFTNANLSDEVDPAKSSFLTDNRGEFEGHIKTATLNHVDFSDAVGSTAPFTIDGNDSGTTLVINDSGTTVVTSAAGLPASYWFGDQAESAFLEVHGSVQLGFPQNVNAVSLAIGAFTNSTQVLTIKEGQVGSTIVLLDKDGNMIDSDSIVLNMGKPNFLGVISKIPFRSIVISSTASDWLFSRLNYAAVLDHCGAATNGCHDNPDYDK